VPYSAFAHVLFFPAILTLVSLVFWSCAEAPVGNSRRIKDLKSEDSSNAPAPQTPDPSDTPEGDLLPVDSVAAFQLKTYPLLTGWCGRCHGAAYAPYFAQGDVKKAHDDLIQSSKVDLKNPDRSRIYLKMIKEQHNCPTASCEESGVELLAAIKQWAASIGSSVDKNGDVAKTSGLSLGATGFFDDFTEPTDSASLQAESGDLRPPMTKKSEEGAQGSQLVEIPAGTPSRLTETPQTAGTLGSATYKFSLRRAGSYRIVGRVRGSGNPTSSFYLRIDGGPLTSWAVPSTNGKLEFDVARTALNAQPITVNLSAGMHTLELLQREGGTACDTLSIVPDPTLDAQSLPKMIRQLRALTYDLAPLTGIAGAQLSVDVGPFGTDGSYVIKNPRIYLSSGSIRVKGLKPFINDSFNPIYATFLTVDQTVTPPGGVLSSSTLVVLKDLGKDKDSFSFGFDTIEGKP
jgi:hypothetical protein